MRFFERACAKAGVELREMELEAPERPPWRSIRREIVRSQVLFVSLCEALSGIDYRHTQNWIDYEVGLACMRNMPIWVFQPEGTEIDFPVPYATHTLVYGFENDEHIKWLGDELRHLKMKGAGYYDTAPFPSERYDGNPRATCTNPSCGLEFFQLNRTGAFRCPSCGQEMMWIEEP
ncbi:MAG: hypothetical protein ACREDE_00880 [Thermoplasmata archaeon]